MIPTHSNTTSIRHSVGFLHANKEATRHFATGNYKESLPHIQAALIEARRMIAAKHNDIGMDSAFGHAKARTSTMRQPSNEDLLAATVALDPMLRATVPELDNSSGVTFFDRMFLMANSNSSGNDETLIANDENETSVCALLLYNMGVAHHLGGLLTGSEEELTIALKVYRMALDFLQSQQADEEEESALRYGMTIQLLCLALANNVAHIQSCIWFVSEETNQCIEWLRSAAKCMEPYVLQNIDFMFFFVHYYVVPSSNGPISSPAA